MPEFEPDRDVAEIAARILKDIPRMDRADLEKILKVTIDATLMQSATMAEQRSRIDQLEALNATLSAKLMDGPEDVVAQMQADGRLSPDYHPGEDMPAGGVELPPELVNPNGPWKTPLPEGHEAWVQRMQECPDEFVRRMFDGRIYHRSCTDKSSFIAYFDRNDCQVWDKPMGPNSTFIYILTPALRAAIDKMEVVG